MSDGVHTSTFDLLARPIQRWIYRREWPALRDAQERAIPVILDGARDVLIAAATATGKTEAAFLPICSALLKPASQPGVRVIYLAPLKALINDQFGRVEDLCVDLDIPVTRWHGDAPQAAKRRLLDRPDGILLITPESLEALFVNHGSRVGAVLGGLQYVVVDELHAFLGTERGAQLLSLLRRVEHAIGRRVPRVGLSATLGDMGIAATQLRPEDADGVFQIVSTGGSLNLRLQLRGYEEAQPRLSVEDEGVRSAEDRVAEHLFQALRGGHHLVFANSRHAVEGTAVRLTDRSERLRVRNEFLPHHGSLSKEIREQAEAALRDPSQPATVIATSTLEMGIDVGSVDSVAQIGVPSTVAALRQRLGRSGRRTNTPVLRCYAIEAALSPGSDLLDELRVGLVQAVASLQLLLERWCEPPDRGALHLSTLTQQLMSVIAQRGDLLPSAAYRLLCGPSSPFAAVTQAQFAQLMRDLAAANVLMQAGDGTLLLAPTGERVASHYSFYAAFTTVEEYRICAGAKTLGSISTGNAVSVGGLLAFAGRHWRITEVDTGTKTIYVEPGTGGRPPIFNGGAVPIHEVVRERMRQVYEAADCPAYCDETALELLRQGRRAYDRLGLRSQRIVATGGFTYVFPWTGTRATNTLALALQQQGLETDCNGLTIATTSSLERTTDAFAAIASGAAPDGAELAARVRNKHGGKYDHWLSEPLLCADYAARALDVPGALAAAKAIQSS